MKLTTYSYAGKTSFGVVTNRGICDAASLWPDGPTSLLDALQMGSNALAKIAELAAKADSFVAADDVTFLAPIPAPPKVVALAGNYVEHIRESKKMAAGLSEAPRLDTTPRPFLMPATVIADPGAEIPWPCYSRQIDYEVELAVIIGSSAKCVSAENAAAHIAGYTIANDVSARSTTFAEERSQRPWDEFYDWLNGKWADGFLPLGPYLVTPDEVGDVRDLDIELTVNGKTRQKASTAQMIFDVFEIVSFVSHIMTLTPGDVIATGTPSGVGAAGGDFLNAGDTITCRIQNIGELTNTLGRLPKTFYTPCVR
ncbi:MAG: fumarylacetoacetate hydrolase family protein [Phycisphaerae bacterium]|nr:fumarylacetoacetate hydrolase family protein [Phycisphaerae bacterium]